MRGTALMLVALLLIAGCEDGDGGSGTSNKPDPNIRLVQKRYDECLKKLHAKDAEARTEQVSFDTDEGLLVIEVVDRNGKTYTKPQSSEDARVLATVGC